jgi:hypothetical protein
MTGRLILIAVAFLAAAAPGFAQAAPDLRTLAERINRLETELAAYKKNYASLDRLFLELSALFRESFTADDELLASAREAVREGRAIEAQIDATVADSKAVIEYLETKVAVRPVLLFTGEAGYQVLLGARAGASVAWEPLPWLGVKAGAELWYTDELKLSFPIVITVRLGIE